MSQLNNIVSGMNISVRTSNGSLQTFAERTKKNEPTDEPIIDRNQRLREYYEKFKTGKISKSRFMRSANRLDQTKLELAKNGTIIELQKCVQELLVTQMQIKNILNETPADFFLPQKIDTETTNHMNILGKIGSKSDTTYKSQAKILGDYFIKAVSDNIKTPKYKLRKDLLDGVVEKELQNVFLKELVIVLNTYSKFLDKFSMLINDISYEYKNVYSEFPMFGLVWNSMITIDNKIKEIPEEEEENQIQGKLELTEYGAKAIKKIQSENISKIAVDKRLSNLNSNLTTSIMFLQKELVRYHKEIQTGPNQKITQLDIFVTVRGLHDYVLAMSKLVDGTGFITGMNSKQQIEKSLNEMLKEPTKRLSPKR